MLFIRVLSSFSARAMSSILSPGAGRPLAWLGPPKVSAPSTQSVILTITRDITISPCVYLYYGHCSLGMHPGKDYNLTRLRHGGWHPGSPDYCGLRGLNTLIRPQCSDKYSAETRKCAPIYPGQGHTHFTMQQFTAGCWFMNFRVGRLLSKVTSIQQQYPLSLHFKQSFLFITRTCVFAKLSTSALRPGVRTTHNPAEEILWILNEIGNNKLKAWNL